jgi:hypothetical protein
VVLLASACRKKKDEVGVPSNDGKAPAIEINGDNQLRDTFKYTTSKTYDFNFVVKDDQDKLSIAISKLEEGLILYKNGIINGGETDITGVTQGSLSFRPLRAGSFAFSITVKDPQGLSSSALVELNALANQVPVAVFTAQQTNAQAPNQVSIDASKSFDTDARWGGKITKYEYTLEGFYTRESDRNKIEYIFPKAGTYRIGIRVQDNDAAWSPIVYQEVVVN